MRLFERELKFDAREKRSGQIVVHLGQLPVGAAESSLTGLIAAENYYESNPTLFFPIIPKVYWATRNLIDLK